MQEDAILIACFNPKYFSVDECNSSNYKIDEIYKMSKIKKDAKYYNNIIDQIEKVRSKNNVNWMNLVRLSFSLDPKKASKILSQIYKQDQKISALARKLNELVNVYNFKIELNLEKNKVPFLIAKFQLIIVESFQWQKD